jgi:predicted molibdopterin-dependent oxidoreductase YjgC
MTAGSDPGGLSTEEQVNPKSRRLTGNVARGRAIQLTVDGEPLPAYEGETIAAVLLAAGRRTLRHAAPGADPRGIFCGIGVCFDCLVRVDGTRNVRACITPVRDGMQVTTLPGC